MRSMSRSHAAALVLLLAPFAYVSAIENCQANGKIGAPCAVRAMNNWALNTSKTEIGLMFVRPYCVTSCVVDTYESGSKVKVPSPASSSVIEARPSSEPGAEPAATACDYTESALGYRVEEFYARGLVPGRKYEFRVYCRNDNATFGPKGTGPATTLTFTANPCKEPGQPTNIRKVSSTREGSKVKMTIAWDAPRDTPRQCINKYKLMVSDTGTGDVEFHEVANTSYTSNTFEAGKSYSIEVFPVNDIGGDGASGLTQTPIKA